ncbi:hypothetical protein [Clostridium beijerinckii]|uniref:Cell wall-binding protein n=1 Tax=Clostridium beijerinckii TaxID=1520 RepID=A0AAX0AZG6_CLOBE|nr:hypothetical protein [Clostridium beijerinckii]NRT88092.1 hypothetical protein [Clostridium beijerinckii]NYC73520.1 hypothetical protein [Clostridium beijerinckii]
MKNFKRLIASFVTLITILAATPLAAHAAWKQDNTGWWYTEGNSWATNWRHIGDKWYYFYSNGYMAHDTTINGYYVNSNGEWVQQLSNVANNAIDKNTQTTNLATDNSKTDSIRNESKETKQSDYNNDEDDIDYEEDDDDYTVKHKNTTNASSSNVDTTSSASDSYYDYTPKGNNETWVSGYYRKNGTYVNGHYRTKKDSTTSNNYSHKGNINPHNGKRGYKK